MAAGDVIWSGWLSLAVQDSNRWKKRYFCLTIDTLEYYADDSGNGALNPTAATLITTGTVTDFEVPTQDHDGNTDFSLGLPPLSRAASDTVSSSSRRRSTFALAEEQDSITASITASKDRVLSIMNTSDSNSCDDSSRRTTNPSTNTTPSRTTENVSPSSLIPSLSQPNSTTTSDGVNAKLEENSIQQEAQGKISLEKLSGLCLLSDSQTFRSTENECLPIAVEDFLEECSRLHRNFHVGPTMLLLVFSMQEYMDTVWRIEFCDKRQVECLINALGDAVPRAVVRAAGWMHAQGTISWSKRYAFLLSTGSLLVFKDPSLKNLRRHINLGRANAIQPIKPIPIASSVLENEIVSELSENSFSYRDFTGIRILHPSIPEKRGYVVCIPPIADLDTDPLQHYGRFKEWLRLLRVLGCEADMIGKLLMTLDGSCKHRMMRMKLLRESERARRPLSFVVQHCSYRITPAIRAIARAGFPPELRGHLWSGYLCYGYNKEMANFENVDKGEPPRSQYQILVKHALKNLSSKSNLKFLDETVLLVERLVFKHPSIGLSPQLLSIANVIVCNRMSTDVDGLHMFCALEAISTRMIQGYHQHNMCTKSMALASITKAKTKETSRYRINYSDISIFLQIDVCIILDLLVEYFPNSCIHKSSPAEIRSIVANWIMSLFSCDVPFSSQCSLRLWDMLCIEKLSTTWSALIRLTLALILVLEPAMLQCQSSKDIGELLTDPYFALSNREHLPTMACKDQDAIADSVIDTAYRHPRILQAASYNSLCERRLHYCNQVSEQAKRRMILVRRWKTQLLSLNSICTETMEMLNCNGTDFLTTAMYDDEQHELNNEALMMQVRIAGEIHETIVRLDAQIIRMERALCVAESSLKGLAYSYNLERNNNSTNSEYENRFMALLSNHRRSKKAIFESNLITYKNSCPCPCPYPIYSDACNEATNFSNLHILRGPQICINPTLVSQLARAAVSTGWVLSGAVWQLLHRCEVTSLQNLHYNVRCVSLHTRVPDNGQVKLGGDIDVGKKLIANSLVATSRLLTPLQDLKSVSTIGASVEMRSILDKLQNLHVYLNEMVQCIADTTAEQNSPGSTMDAPIAYNRTENDNIFVKDLFGGHADSVSQLVPFILEHTHRIYSGIYTTHFEELKKHKVQNKDTV